MDGLEEYGSCTNCKTTVHMSQMGYEFGIECCVYCHDELREKLMSSNVDKNEAKERSGVR